MVVLINVSLYYQMSIWTIYVFNVYVYQNYSGNLQYGAIKILLYLIYTHGIMVNWGFVCNKEEPLDDIKHSIYLHL